MLIDINRLSTFKRVKLCAYQLQAPPFTWGIYRELVGDLFGFCCPMGWAWWGIVLEVTAFFKYSPNCFNTHFNNTDMFLKYLVT